MAENNETQTQEATAQTNGAAASEPSETDVLKAQLQEAQNKYLYLYAEFENFKKRVIKERSDLIKFGHESLIRDLLQVPDNLDRALDHTGGNVEALITGIKMVNQQLKETFTKYGVNTVNALGEKFDPSLHEAVAQEKISGESNGQQEGTVIKEHQKGYTLHGRLLRPARVVVATK